MRIWLGLIILGIFSIAGNAQGIDSPEVKSGQEEAILRTPLSDRDSLLLWREKVILHVSNTQLQARERLFFKAYLTTGIRQVRISQSRVLKIEMVNGSGEVFHRQYHPITDGMASGNFEIPRKTKEGKYYLRAFTQWMENYGPESFASIPLYIGDKKHGSDQNINLVESYRIIPEGGHLLNGFSNKVVLAKNVAGSLDLSVPLEIVDHEGNHAGLFTSYPGGLYSATFTPDASSHYRIRSSEDQFINIEKARSEGYLLQVNNLAPDKIRIRVSASSEFYNSNVKIAGEMDGIRLTDREFNVGPMGIVDFELSKTSFPAGIMMLRLLDMEGGQLAYRPVWIDKEKVDIEISDLRQVAPEEYEFEILVRDHNHQPIKTSVAVGISGSDENGIFPTGTSGNLSAGYIETPGMSGESDTDRNERFLEDMQLLSMTETIDQGIDVQDLSEIKYPVQKGLNIYGYAYDMENKLLKERDIQLMAFSEDQVWALETKSDPNGAIRLEDLQLSGESQLVFRIKEAEEESTLVKVVPTNLQAENNSESLDKEIRNNAKKRVFEPSTYNLQDTTGLIALEEVILEEKAIDKKESPSLYNVNPTRVRYQDPERPKTIPQLLMDMPGVIVSGLGSLNPSVSVLRASGPVLWVIDGFPISTSGVTPGFVNPGVVDDGGNGGFPGSSSAEPGNDAVAVSPITSSGSSALTEVMNIVSAYDVEKIELLFGPDAAIFGSRVASAVFLVYTRSGNSVERSMRKDAQLKFQGYQPEIEFAEYFDELSKKAKRSVETFYWNPQVETDTNGKATVRLLTENNDMPLQVEISTVTQDGRIGVLNKVLSVK